MHQEKTSFFGYVGMRKCIPDMPGQISNFRFLISTDDGIVVLNFFRNRLILLKTNDFIG